jgi:hypothetical protein
MNDKAKTDEDATIKERLRWNVLGVDKYASAHSRTVYVIGRSLADADFPWFIVTLAPGMMGVEHATAFESSLPMAKEWCVRHAFGVKRTT